MEGSSTQMANDVITKDEIMAVYPKVAETMADALGCDVADIKPNVSLIEGLDAESIDFLDMVFRLERAFKIKIPRGKIVENARGSFAIPPDVAPFSSCLLAEAVGQLAAWVAMSHIDFRGRPVAALANETL